MTLLRPIGQHMNIAVKQFEQAQTPSQIIPRHNIDKFTANGVIVQIDNERETIQYLVDWNANYEGIEMSASCTLTVFAEDGLAVSEDVIETPDWICCALTHDVEGHLTQLEEDLCCEALCCEADF